ncbi:GntR family transcriptional regulator [Streptomyces sp. NPDC052236]|uniref:GntR family transcriptional regulator n=1 Tax=Streptomyces sp. NPDC052236 TaxID=3365686 RepID=UPI0037D08DD0
MPRTTQLRTFTVQEGLLDEWVERWRSDIVPLRLELGFTIDGAWVDREAIFESGKLPTGAALPGERAMTEIYSVSIGTARRALRELRERGLVATLPHKGTFVIYAPPAASGDER